MIRFVSAHLLRRHIADRAHHRAWIGNLFPGIDFRTDTLVSQRSQLRQTKVENLHAAISSDEEVFGLKISMGNSSLMRRRQTLSNLLNEVECLALRERAVVELLTQLFSVEQF